MYLLEELKCFEENTAKSFRRIVGLFEHFHGHVRWVEMFDAVEKIASIYLSSYVSYS